MILSFDRLHGRQPGCRKNLCLNKFYILELDLRAVVRYPNQYLKTPIKNGEQVMTRTAKQPFNGGSFLIEDRTPTEIFTPEDINEEQRMFAATAEEFLRKELLPREKILRRWRQTCAVLR